MRRQGEEERVGQRGEVPYDDDRVKGSRRDVPVVPGPPGRERVVTRSGQGVSQKSSGASIKEVGYVSTPYPSTQARSIGSD